MRRTSESELDEGTGHVRRIERALEDAEGRLRLLSAHIRGILFELDSQVRFVRVWASDPQLLARPEHELLGQTILETLGPEVGRQHHEAARATVETGKPARYEYELDVPGGHRHFACESVAVPAPNSDQRHAVFWIRDITEEVRLQKKLLEAERLASVGTLAAGVAHEINNPLAYMLLNAEQLRAALHGRGGSGGLDTPLETLRLCADMIHDGTKRVQRIVGELLQFAKPVEPVEAVDVREVTELALEITRGLCERWAKVTTPSESVPCVLAHHERLAQVFIHLLTNAAEAIPADGAPDHAIVVSTRCEGGDTVCVDFRDTGEGIPEENAGRIFEPFFTTKEDGTGLGLAICRRIVNSFSGELRYQRGEPRGSLFQVLLPAVGSTRKA